MVVEKFKLLGVKIDKDQNFNQHVSAISLQINKNIHSIQRLFYLSTNVKLKFVKTFFLPYFNFCISLVISYIKTAIQKLCILYYNLLHKLFKFQLNEREVNWVNDFWKRFNLLSFQHRIFYRLSIFTYISKSKFELRKNSDKEIEIGYELRNKDKYIAVEYELVTGKKTKAYFFNNFKNAWFHLFW